jgi:RNA polymerase sigma factor (sigma-70 family)
MALLSSVVDDCLRGSVEAHLALDREMRPRLEACLKGRGATNAVAEEISADVLSECFLRGEDSLLHRYHGKREFEGWLLRVAINRLIDRQRRQLLIQRKNLEGAPEGMEFLPDHPDAVLARIIQKALAEAFAGCEPQVRVLLWLAYAFEVKQSRLAAAWDWSESKLSRTLTSSCEAIRERTLSAIHEIEPGLVILWEDVVDVCADDVRTFFKA